jgi:DNA-binding transcriptional LysR family regulator
MKFCLPPLNTLRLFEAAGRHLNFKSAAHELGITPSAVSHAVQALEDWLGSALFHRNGRAITLTAAGDAYLPAVAEALALLARAADQASGSNPGNTIHISATPIEAAVGGLGIAIGRRPFIEAELGSGALVRFCSREVPAGAGYWLAAPPEAMKRPDVQAVRDWLFEELRPFRDAVGCAGGGQDAASPLTRQKELR